MCVSFTGPKCETVEKMLNIARDFYIPGLLLLHYDPEQSPESLTRPAISKFKMVRNETTAYLCHNRACQLPITNPDDLRRNLTEKYLAASVHG